MVRERGPGDRRSVARARRFVEPLRPDQSRVQADRDRHLVGPVLVEARPGPPMDRATVDADDLGESPDGVLGEQRRQVEASHRSRRCRSSACSCSTTPRPGSWRRGSRLRCVQLDQVIPPQLGELAVGFGDGHRGSVSSATRAVSVPPRTTTAAGDDERTPPGLGFRADEARRPESARDAVLLDGAGTYRLDPVTQEIVPEPVAEIAAGQSRRGDDLLRRAAAGVRDVAATAP